MGIFVNVKQDNYHQMTIDDVLETLYYLRDDLGVVEVCRVNAEGGSYRGYYHEFYLQKSSSSVSINKLITFFNTEVLGEWFEGYKGGEYIMGYDTQVFIASYGCTGSALVGFRVDGNLAYPELEEDC